MKSNKIWYLGYSISLFSLILLLTLDLNEALRVCLIMVFAISLAVSHVQIMHRRLLETDHDYKISMNDERNEKIRDKVNATMASVLMLLMGMIAVVCISLHAYVPAALLAISLGCSPILMIMINKYYEGKY
ncbi:DUF2178 domain-containing protein [Granulicatella sp. HMSC31F03]|jgi:hypothetical protein|uniref:DUF2178 domain-containing protein n=1 Tax=Granulicatella sp. HMSC31F03 TaxID=1581074 RepID=UPI0008A53613|nr:DUF2178 domain-containing protein [Granulicatella sp. HMSC31F03]OFS99262.1 hypothetical protein HMPREF3106_07885 [Granulicatella sp. HMSC31F03]